MIMIGSVAVPAVIGSAVIISPIFTVSPVIAIPRSVVAVVSNFIFALADPPPILIYMDSNIAYFELHAARFLIFVVASQPVSILLEITDMALIAANIVLLAADIRSAIIAIPIGGSGLHSGEAKENPGQAE